MAVYNPKSLKAEEFINDEEIRATLAYAEENKNNVELIDQILEKARPVKNGNGCTCRGLTHREASVLLACEIPEKIQRMYEIAEEIKLAFYGNRIVLFAPLYLSNYCVNGCVYCPYHMKNKHIARKKLTQEEVRAEVIALQDMGHKRLAIEAGEDPVNNPIEYILDCIHTIYSVHHKDGDIRRVHTRDPSRCRQGDRLLFRQLLPGFQPQMFDLRIADVLRQQGFLNLPGLLDHMGFLFQVAGILHGNLGLFSHCG